MNEDEISETLDKVVPHREVPEGMLAGARRRRRRTRTLTGGAAVALVAALAIPIGLTLGSAGRQSVATPAATPTVAETPSSLEPAACRNAEGDYPAVTELPGGSLPDGATRVWLCGGASNSFAANTYVGAAEPLSRNVADAVAAFNAVPSEVGAIDCPANTSIGFTVVYEYPGGVTRTLRGDLGGCEAVVSSDTFRMEAATYLEDLRSLWAKQRTALGTVFSSDVPVCSARTSVMGVVLADMVRAYACGPIVNEDGSTDSVQIPLSDEVVSDIVEEIASQDVMVGVEPGVSMEPPSIVLLSPTGDPFTLLGGPDQYMWYDPEPAGMNVWRPSRALAARISEEMTRDGLCTASPRLVPSDVRVDVYDAGGGAASVAEVTQHLEEAGFVATNTGKDAVPSLGGPIIIRGGPNSDRKTELVGSQFTGFGGEVSRSDDVVDVLVAEAFTSEGDVFAADPLPDVATGALTCTSPPPSPSPTSATTPAKWPSQTPSPSVGERGGRPSPQPTHS